MHKERVNTRLKDWDYSSEGFYFLTLTCKNKEHFFGKIENKTMHLSDIGSIAFQFWMEIPNHFSYVRLDEFVIMPDHVHGILIVGPCNVVRPRHGVALPEQNSSNVGPCHGMASQSVTKKIRILNQFSKPVKDSVSVIINQYKSSVKRWCNKNGFKDFEWQARFYDHIIRNSCEVMNIREYIKDNPANWIDDES